MNAVRGPVTEAERIRALDTLRGFALLGILVMNIQSFSMPFAAYFNPTAFGDLSGANWWTWLAGRLLFDQKFMTIFSPLFGAGIVLMTTRVAGRGDSPMRFHYRRMVWLLVIGMIHAYLLWYGDILVLYALGGMMVYPARKLSPRALLILGLVVLALGSGLSMLAGWSMPYWPPEDVKEITEFWSPSPETLKNELANYRGGWLEQMPHRIKATFDFHLFEIWVWGIWRAAGLMLAGMGLYKLGVFSAAKSPGFYKGLAGLTPVGIAIVAYGVKVNLDAKWDMRVSFFFADQFNYWGSLLVSLGYVGLVMLLWQSGVLTALTRRLEAVGRMALSNYLMHTIVCTAIFYGHGLGFFGSVPRIGLLGMVVAIWIVQLVGSTIWLRHFQFGPFEWTWRALTYGTRPEFRRIQAAAA